jgi:hypothetical protein
MEGPQPRPRRPQYVAEGSLGVNPDTYEIVAQTLTSNWEQHFEKPSQLACNSLAKRELFSRGGSSAWEFCLVALSAAYKVVYHGPIDAI